MAFQTESDSEKAALHQDLLLAGQHAQMQQAETMACVQRAAATVTSKDLGRWSENATKLWTAQTGVAQKHGPAYPQTVRRQLRHAGLGTGAGVGLPLCLFGVSLLEHGFVLPLFWVAAVAADVAGRIACIRTAAVPRTILEEQPKATPSDCVLLLNKALLEARAYNHWAPVDEAALSVVKVDSELRSGDDSLRRARRAGRLWGLLALGVAAISALVTDSAVVILLIAPVVIYGLSLWRTSSAYTGAIEQPPYPTRGSSKALLASLEQERSLHSYSFDQASSTDIRKRVSPQMKLIGSVHSSLRKLEQHETDLNDAQWALAILEAERASS